jgi:hypothetical protein
MNLLYEDGPPPNFDPEAEALWRAAADAPPAWDADDVPHGDAPDLTDEDSPQPAGRLRPAKVDARGPLSRQWPKLHPDALHGLAGEIVRAVAAHSEADGSALLLTLLVWFGAAVGRAPHARVGGARHSARLFVVIVGQTAKARKGTSLADLRPIFDIAEPGFDNRMLSGFGSGEKLIDEVRDCHGEDAGASDRRLLVTEPEFSRVLKVAQREASTLSPIIREAWDGSRLQVRSRTSTVSAVDHHVCVIGHITAEELRRALDTTEIANGFANRFLYACAQRSKRLPTGGALTDADYSQLGEQLGEAVRRARSIQRMTRSPEAERAWAEFYNAVDDDVPGVFGAITARAEAQVLRLSVVFALLDGSSVIELHHLDAALAVWRYCDDSAAWIFDQMVGDPRADKLFAALVKAGPSGLTRTEQSKVFGGNVPKELLQELRGLLENTGRVETLDLSGPNGRPRHVTRVKPLQRG